MYRNFIKPSVVAQMDEDEMVKVSRTCINSQQVMLNLYGQGEAGITDDLHKRHQIIQGAMIGLRQADKASRCVLLGAHP